MDILKQYLLPGEEPIKRFKWVLNEFCITNTRVLFTCTQENDLMVIIAPIRNVLAVSVNNSFYKTMNDHLKVNIGGHWIRIDAPMSQEIATALAEVITPYVYNG